MRLSRDIDELIQDYVDGNLTGNRQELVRQLLESNPKAQEAADQYRFVTQSVIDLEPIAVKTDDKFINSVMSQLPEENYWLTLIKRDSLSIFVVLTVVAAMVWLVDISAISAWLKESLLPNFAAVASLKDSVMQVAERLNGVLPYLGFSVLVIIFYGLLDRVVGSSRRASRA